MNAKQVVSIFALAALLSTTTVANANPTDDKKVSKATATASTSAFSLWMHSPASTNALKVHVQKHTKEAVTVQLKDQRGAVLYSEKISAKQPGKALLFNLSDLADGTYSLEVAGDGQQVSKSFELKVPSSTRTLTVE